MLSVLLLCSAVVGTILCIGYLAACAGAERFLSLREWLARTSCSHTHGRLIAIEWDGESVYECAACGKRVSKPL